LLVFDLSGHFPPAELLGRIHKFLTIESDEAFDRKTLKEHPGETGECRIFLRITRDKAAE